MYMKEKIIYKIIKAIIYFLNFMSEYKIILEKNIFLNILQK